MPGNATQGEREGQRLPAGAPAAAPRRLGRDARLRLYVITVIAVAGGAGALAGLERAWISPPGEGGWLALPALMIAALVLERFGTNLFGDSRVSVSFIPLFGIALLLGPAAAALAAVVTVGVAQLLLGRPWLKLLFNVAVVMLANLAAGATFHALSEPPWVDAVLVQVGPAVLALLVAFLGNSVLVAGVVALGTGETFTRVWKEKFPWLAPHFAAAGAMAYAMALAYVGGGVFGAVVFALPVLMLRLAVHQYTSRTRASVEELKAAYAASRESEERFRALVQNAPSVIAIFDADGTIRYFSPTGVTSGPRNGARGPILSVEAIVHADDVPRVRGAIAEAVQQPGTHLPVSLRMRYGGKAAWREFDAILTNLLDHPGVRGIVANARDVTERNALEEQLRHQAFHDPLSGLPNRALFVERLTHALARADRRRAPLAVMLLDLDRFKLVNDSFGHPVGDQLLLAASERLRASLRTGDTLARFGGDEFTILLEDVEQDDDVFALLDRIFDDLRAPLVLEGRETYVTASIGVAFSHSAGECAMDLIRSADIAMYRAKGEGGDQYAVFDTALDAHPADRLELETDLRHAIERAQLRVHYQPEVDLTSGRITGMEALVR